jgi:hypothetical protein
MLVIVSLLFTFSGSALGGIILATLISLIVNLFVFVKTPNRRILINCIYIFLVGLLLVHTDASREVLTKFIPDSDFGSGRGQNWLYFFELIVENNFMPHGLGSASLTGTFPINSYLLILYEAGIFGLIIYLIFNLLPLITIWYGRLINKDKIIFMFIHITSISQLGAFDTFYYPYTIILISVILHISKNGYQRNITDSYVSSIPARCSNFIST